MILSNDDLKIIVGWYENCVAEGFTSKKDYNLAKKIYKEVK